MADLYEVENALVQYIGNVVYPNGIPTNGISPVGGIVINGPVRGWPVSQDLDILLQSGKGMITIYPLAGMTQMTTRFMDKWLQLTENSVNITYTVLNNQIEFSGTVSDNMIAGIFNNGKGYVVNISSIDTPSSIASKLSALISGSSAIGNVLTLNEIYLDFEVGVGIAQTCFCEKIRYLQQFQISLWMPTTLSRDLVGKAISNSIYQKFIELPDLTYGWLKPGMSSYDDKMSKSNEWVRHIRVSVEYGDGITELSYPVLFGVYGGVGGVQT